MSKIQVNFTVGVVSAFYFIIFDLVLLTIVDLVLSRVVNSVYYRRIHRGHPLTVASADIPGISTFLVGRYASLPNIIGIAIKLFFLACIVLIERGINSENTSVVKSYSRDATYAFNASDTVWDIPFRRLVTRRWERVRLCREYDSTTSTSFTFYNLAFNLMNDIQLDDELGPENETNLIEVNETSIHCLSPRRVLEKNVKPMVTVVGCSQLFPTQECHNETIVRVPVNDGLAYTPISRLDDLYPVLMYVESGTGNISVSIVKHNITELAPLFPQFQNTSLYSNPQLTCGLTRIGPSIGKSRMYRACLLVVQYQGNTLIERWTHDVQGDVLVRHFPGPVFNGSLDFGRYQQANHLILFGASFNWESFAATIVADSIIYQRVNWTFETYEPKLVTTVPVYAVALGVVLLFIAVVAKVVVIFTIGKDKRPQLNQIDGLSSVAREEMAPSGRSMVAGRGVLLGLTHRSWGKHLHFGPLLTYREGVARSAGELVE